MTNGSALRESIVYRRAAALPGVEMVDAHRTGRAFRVFNTALGIAMLDTWKGEVQYKGRRHAAGPDMLVCFEAGETHIGAPHASEPGSFKVFNIDTELFGEYAAEHEIWSGLHRWRKVLHRASDGLRHRFTSMFRVLREPASPMESQSRVTELVAGLVGELLERPRNGSARLHAGVGAARRIRDCIHDEPGVDLETLAKATGLSRFQVIRSFKQRYGLPPHAYQICLRIAAAQKWLRKGAAAAEVAIRAGFVDQSHMARHFRRLVGMTPGQYARATGPRIAEHAGIELQGGTAAHPSESMLMGLLPTLSIVSDPSDGGHRASNG